MYFTHVILANVGPAPTLGPLVQVSALWAPTYGLYTVVFEPYTSPLLRRTWRFHAQFNSLSDGID